MNFFSPILAQEPISVNDAFSAWSSLSDEARTRLIVFTAFAVVIIGVFVWAAFLRKPKTKRRRIHKHQPHAWQQTEAVEKRHHRHRHRRHQSPDLPQNPSLAQSGGLPPRRPDDVPPAGT